MNPLLVLSLWATTAWAVRKSTAGRAAPRQLRGVPFRPEIVIVNRCQAWSIPDSWWDQVAQPKFAALVTAGARDADLITYALLGKEVGTCPLPPSMGVQTDLPGSPDYWAGPPTMLFLLHHVREAVAVGLQHFVATGEGPALALPPAVPGGAP